MKLIAARSVSVLSVDGVRGVRYLPQVTTNLGTPTAWETIATNVAETDGLIRFVDPGATDAPMRYYHRFHFPLSRTPSSASARGR